MTVTDRFWAKVDTSGDCWLWTGKPHVYGYGRIRVGGRAGRDWLAHRFSFNLHYGPFDQRLVVRHRCDTPACVRPDHLELGTQADNIEDMLTRKGHFRWKQTRCKRGHEYAVTGVYVNAGRRQCKACVANRMK